MAAKQEPQSLRTKRDTRRLLIDVTPWRDFHKLPDTPLLADWLLMYVHRYACWLLSHRRGTKARLYRQLKQDFPQAAIHERKAVTTLADGLAQQLRQWVRQALSSIKDARLDDLVLTPTEWDGSPHWQLSGRRHDRITERPYICVPMRLPSVESDLASELTRQSRRSCDARARGNLRDHKIFRRQRPRR